MEVIETVAHATCESLWQFCLGMGFDFGVEVWYSEKKEGPAPGRLHIFGLITASMVSRPLAVVFYSSIISGKRASQESE